MIKVVLHETKEHLHAFEVCGHAKSGPYGHDLVCAGVSAITFGATNALIELCGMEPVIKQADNGYLYVELPSDFKEDGEAQTILKAMVVALETMEREYNQFIKITSK
jgi:uncharacterized protein YsxB (DUF464 family)